MVDRSKLIQPDDVSDKPFIFVSYSRQDMQEVQSILRILRNNQFRFWYDMGLKSGTEWAEELGEKIDQCDQFLVLISDHSVNSKYVRKEIGMATDKDKNILVLYLTETKLTSGLHLLLGGIQAIHREFYPDENDFEQAVCKDISRSTFYTVQQDFSNDVTSRFGAEGEFLYNYVPREKIGEGGIGQVYTALQKRTGNLVAVKCGKKDRTFLGSGIIKCFCSEKIILSEVLRNVCPYVPTLLDWYQDEDHVFLVETLIVGKSLQLTDSLSENEVVEIAKKVLLILRCLHRNNIVYGDIKPSNLIVDRYGDIYLVDFNSAVLISENDDTHYMSVTAGYSAPEQYVRESSVSCSSDIYALGRTMEFLLSPSRFNRNERAPIRFYRKDISVELEDILEKMTNPIADQRFQDVDTLLQTLNQYRKFNFIKKIKLLMESSNRIRHYAIVAQRSQEKRIEIVKEMADASQEHGGIVDETFIFDDT